MTKRLRGLTRMLRGVGLSRAYREWKYNRLAGTPRILSFDMQSLREQGFYSQCGQDKWLADSMFPGLRNGVFVDVGAHDGVNFSNTCYLEKCLGWTGIAIEPNPEVFERLSKNRDCIKVNGCLSSRSGGAVFRKITGYSEMLSGLVEQYDPRHCDRIAREISRYGGTAEDIDVTCYRLDSLLEKNGVTHVDYMSIDVEGAEYDILNSIDLNRSDIVVCGIENNYRDYRIVRLMKKSGYDLVAVVGDEFYVRWQ